MQNTKTKEERIESILKAYKEWDLIDAWNRRSEAYRYDDDYIYPMDELDELFYNVKPSEMLSQLSDDFRVRDDFFRCSVFGLESFNYADDVVDYEELIEYIINEDDDLMDAEIREILDECEDDEDEDDEE